MRNSRMIATRGAERAAHVPSQGGACWRNCVHAVCLSPHRWLPCIFAADFSAPRCAANIPARPMPELAFQLSLMAFEAALAAAVLLALFSLRRVFGLAPIYTTVGVFYYLATLLAGTTRRGK